MKRGVVQVSADDTSVVVLQRGLIQQFTGSYLCVFGYGGFILSFWTTSGRCAHHALELCPRRRSPPPSPSPFSYNPYTTNMSQQANTVQPGATIPMDLRNTKGLPRDVNGEREWSNGLCDFFGDCGTCSYFFLFVYFFPSL